MNSEQNTLENSEETENRVWELFIAYLPAILSAVCAVVTIVLYTTVIEVQYWSVYFDQVFLAVVQFAIIFLNRRFSLGLPYYLTALMALHSVLSVDMGTSLGFYGRFPWWDSSVHCFFGFLGAATLYYLYPRVKKGEKAGAVDILGIILAVLAFAAIWELFEYVMGGILNSDMQDVNRLMAEGKNPLSDTMFDMTVAVIGAIVFFAILFPLRRIKERLHAKKLPKEEP